ncbi:hypothetical protein ACEPPN_017237 [Leptodophora sp. 'Broadleaf-Isolate-01']
MMLFGYILDFEEILALQRDHPYNMSNTAAQSAAKRAAISADLEKQFQVLKSIFVENTACEKCGQSPLVTGSKHEGFGNAATERIWSELVEFVTELKNYPLDITQCHLDYIKKTFEKAEKAYRRDDVAANC